MLLQQINVKIKRQDQLLAIFNLIIQHKQKTRLITIIT